MEFFRQLINSFVWKINLEILKYLPLKNQKIKLEKKSNSIQLSLVNYTGDRFLKPYFYSIESENYVTEMFFLHLHCSEDCLYIKLKELFPLVCYFTGSNTIRKMRILKKNFEVEKINGEDFLKRLYYPNCQFK